jgi:hypothetical protein
MNENDYMLPSVRDSYDSIIYDLNKKQKSVIKINNNVTIYNRSIEPEN